MNPASSQMAAKKMRANPGKRMRAKNNNGLPAYQIIQSGIRKVTEGMKHLTMEVLDETHWKRFDSAGRLFWNMNTPGDYEQAKRMVEAERA